MLLTAKPGSILALSCNALKDVEHTPHCKQDLISALNSAVGVVNIGHIQVETKSIKTLIKTRRLDTIL